MESSKTSPIDGSSHIVSPKKDEVVADYEDCNSGVVIDDEQGGEQILGYLEVQGHSGSEDATIILDSQAFNLNGQHLVWAQHDDGKQYLVVVSDDPNDQPLEQAFADASVLHMDGVSFEDELKDHGTIVVDDGSQGLEQFIETEEVPQENEENHIYIENSVINISSEKHCPANSVKAESPVWSDSDQLKNSSTEMIFIPNSTVVSSACMLAPEDTKHPKLMQLACIAGLQSHSVDQKNCNIEGANDICSLLSDTQTSVIVTQSSFVEPENIALTISEVKDPQTIDNAVSVIHTTVSEFQENLEREHITTSKMSSLENYNTIDKARGLSSMYTEISDASFQNDINDCGISKLVEDDNKHLEQQIPADVTFSEERMPTGNTLHDDRMSIDAASEDERMVKDHVHESKTSTELNCLHGGNPSLSFLAKSQDLDVLGIEATPINDDVDNDSHEGSCIIVIEDDESKQGDSNISDTVCINESVEESRQEKASEIDQRAHSQNLEVPYERDSEYNFTESDADDVSASKSTSSFLSTKYSVFSRNSKVKTLFSTLSSNMLPLGIKAPPHESDILNAQDANRYPDDRGSLATFSSDEELTAENNNTDLVIAEDSESNSDTKRIGSSKHQISPNPTLGTLSPSIAEDNHAASKISENLTFEKDIFHAHGTEQCRSGNNRNDIIIMNSGCLKDLEDNTEETLVKPPKKTYIRKKTHCTDSSSTQDKIELFSECSFNLSECDKDIQEIQNSVNIDLKENLTSEQSSAKSAAALSMTTQERSILTQESTMEAQDNHFTSDDLLSNMEIKVSATYDKKKKITLTPKKDMKFRSLRPRSSSSKKLNLNGTEETQSVDVQITNFDPNCSENILWGDELLRTQFQSSVPSNKAPVTAKDSPSPAFFKSSPSSEKRKRSDKQRYLSNSRNSDFDSLLSSQSGKSKIKCIKIKRKFLDGKKKGKKYGSKHNVSVISTKSQRTDCSHKKHSNDSSQSVIEKSRCQSIKKAELRYSIRPKKFSEKGSESRELNYCCSSCDFASAMVDNLIEHSKYCIKSLPPIDFSVDDMDKRQRIRGDNIDTLRPEGLMEYIHSSLEAVRGECSGLSHNHISDSEDDDVDLDFMKSKYGYCEDDVVWAKVEDRFWPGLICELTEKTAFVKLINYPTEKKGVKKNAERVHTFDDAKWNKMLLDEAESLPNNEIFVKAVQTSETFVRKKWLGQNVKGKEFFSIPDQIEFVTDNESSDCNINEDSDYEITDPYAGMRPSRRARYENIDVEKVKNYIIGGHLDDYVIDIYHKKVNSQKHMKYFREGKTNVSLTQKSWFGPCENIFEQGILVDHFHTLFLKQIGERYFFLSYILEVWIPEAIVKAISNIQEIALRDAEELFESEDSLDNDDPSIEEIEKMYS